MALRKKEIKEKKRKKKEEEKKAEELKTIKLPSNANGLPNPMQ